MRSFVQSNKGFFAIFVEINIAQLYISICSCTSRIHLDGEGPAFSFSCALHRHLPATNFARFRTTNMRRDSTSQDRQSHSGRFTVSHRIGYRKGEQNHARDYLAVHVKRIAPSFANPIRRTSMKLPADFSISVCVFLVVVAVHSLSPVSQ
jgi:hypothetical protein